MPARRERTTLAAVARMAGVSVATVSKVVNGRSDVAPRTRSRVQALLVRHDYVAPVSHRPATAARPTVEVQFAGSLGAYAAEALDGIVDAAAREGVSAVVGRPAGDPQWARDLVAAGRSALIAVASVYTAARLEALTRAGLPLVVLDPLHAPRSEVNSVGSTNFAGGLAATQHLLGLGHRRVAHLGGPAEAPSSTARLHGYRAAMAAAQAPVPRAYVRPGDFTYRTGLLGAAALLDLAQPPTAIFAANDEMAAGVVEAARTRGVRVPEDLSVVGFDDTSLARMSAPPLTTVRQPLREMGGVALRTALRLAGGEKIESHHIELATELVVRGSTRPV
jgi:LacI family transcriptional regulator